MISLLGTNVTEIQSHYAVRFRRPTSSCCESQLGAKAPTCAVTEDFQMQYHDGVIYSEPSVVPLWTVKECAAYLHKSPRWLWREIARGNVPHVRVGQTPRFIPQDIAEWVHSGCPKPAEKL